MFQKLALLLSTGKEAPNLFWFFVLCLWSKQSEFKVFFYGFYGVFQVIFFESSVCF